MTDGRDGGTERHIYFVDDIKNTEGEAAKPARLEDLSTYLLYNPRGTYHVKIVGNGKERKEEALCKGQVRRIINSAGCGEEIYIQRVRGTE